MELGSRLPPGATRRISDAESPSTRREKELMEVMFLMRLVSQACREAPQVQRDMRAIGSTFRYRVSLDTAASG